jgi:hypothetical protein
MATAGMCVPLQQYNASFGEALSIALQMMKSWMSTRPVARLPDALVAA